MNINWDNVNATLEIMGKGMLGIFVVTLVIIGITWCLNAVTGKK